MPVFTGGYERQARHTEGLLLLLVLMTLLSGVLLVATAKHPAEPSEAININTLPDSKVARVFDLPPRFAALFIAIRKKQHGFSDVDALARTKPIIGGQTVTLSQLTASQPNLVVRTWAEALRPFLIYCGGLALLLVTAHFLIRRFRPRADPYLLPIVGFLSALSLLLLFSLKDPLRDRLAFEAQGTGILIGGGLALLFALSGFLNRLPLHRYGYLYALAAVLGTVLLGVAGTGPGGVRLSLAGTQPIEFIKVLMVFFLAAYLAERGSLLNDATHRWGTIPVPRPRDAAPLVVLYALPLVLFAIVRDLGPVLLLFGAFLLLIYAATQRRVYVVLGLVALGIGGFVGYRLHFGVFATRVDMLLSPWSNTHKGGDQLALGMWGMAGGGLFGTGLGLGGTHFIPRGGSDLAFSSLGEEIGLIGNLVVILCFLIIAVRGVRIAQNAATEFDRLLALGLSSLLTLQTVIITWGNLGIFPLAGITLPFVSNGKSSLVASFFMVGMLLLLSARSQPGSPPPPPVFVSATRRMLLLFTVLLGVIAPLRMLWVQALDADGTAGRIVRVPDADKQIRAHLNPRLLLLANRIPRKRFLDRGGRVLAETVNNKRVYPFGAATAHLIGYADPAVGGPQGLEKQFEGKLRGFDQWKDLVLYWRIKDLPGARLPEGKDVVLSLDAELQKAALAALTANAARVRDRRTGGRKHKGAVVVLDVETGEVLAAVTLPTFDPNTLTPEKLRALTADPNGDFPLINRATSGYYPPGSTFKIVTASALLANHRDNFTYLCNHIATGIKWTGNGKIYARRRIVDDETDRPHGTVNLSAAVAQSCNIYFANAGIALGAQPLHHQAALFGFARLPSAPRILAELPDVSYGQGPMLASPMEMAQVALTVANQGKHLRPQFIKGDAPTVDATPLTPESAASLANMMRQVTVSGTAAHRFDLLGYPVAGKTGTAQNKEGDKMAHSWFIGFAPADHPRVAFAVVVENGGYGASVAVPVARDVLKAAKLR